MAFTRGYVGAHYPGDVVAGLALGGLIATMGWFAVVSPWRRAPPGTTVIDGYRDPNPEGMLGSRTSSSASDK